MKIREIASMCVALGGEHHYVDDDQPRRASLLEELCHPPVADCKVDYFLIKGRLQGHVSSSL